MRPSKPCRRDRPSSSRAPATAASTRTEASRRACAARATRSSAFHDSRCARPCPGDPLRRRPRVRRGTRSGRRSRSSPRRGHHQARTRTDGRRSRSAGSDARPLRRSLAGAALLRRVPRSHRMRRSHLQRGRKEGLPREKRRPWQPPAARCVCRGLPAPFLRIAVHAHVPLHIPHGPRAERDEPIRTKPHDGPRRARARHGRHADAGARLRRDAGRRILADARNDHRHHARLAPRLGDDSDQLRRLHVDLPDDAPPLRPEHARHARREGPRDRALRAAQRPASERRDAHLAPRRRALRPQPHGHERLERAHARLDPRSDDDRRTDREQPRRDEQRACSGASARASAGRAACGSP